MIRKPTVRQVLETADATMDSVRFPADLGLLDAISMGEKRRLAGIQRLLASGLHPRIARIPITNVFSGCDYSARITIGSQHATADVILDTGSSTLAVMLSAYDGTGDKHLQPTTHAQVVEYGIGGWAGPVVNTSVGFGPGISLRNTPIAIWSVDDIGVLKRATGIMGLAYNDLNDAFDLTSYFEQTKKTAATYLWPFPEQDFSTFHSDFRQLRKTYGIHGQSIAPYFGDLESGVVVANKFAFHTLRSWVSKRAGSDAAITTDPLNQGILVRGGGEEQTDLYEGAFVEVKVLDDLYCNTKLKSLQVDGCSAVVAEPLQAKYINDSKTNSIIDSGTSVLWLTPDVYAAVIDSLKQLDPAFGAAIADVATASKQNQGVPASRTSIS
jgi:hypothetical protein